jgi:hypothetical protein
LKLTRPKPKYRKKRIKGAAKVALLKPFKIPDDFRIVVDTREQQSIFEDGDELASIIETRVLHEGDYSISGYEDRFAIERKKMSDLYAYCGREFRSKTQAKLERFRSMIEMGGWVGLIIQATEYTVLSGHSFSKLSPEVVRQQIASFEVKYGINVYFNLYSKNLRRWTLDRMLKFWKYNHKKIDEGNGET